MKPRLHVAMLLTAWIGGGGVIVIAAVLLFNSINAPVGPLLGVTLAIVAFVVGPRLLRWALPVTCPECRQRAEYSTRPKLIYRCRHCGFHWDTKLQSGGGGGLE